MAVSNSADAYKVQRKVLTITGIWPQKNPSIFYGIQTLLSWLAAIGICSIMLTQIIHDRNNFTKLSETLYIMFSYMNLLVKLAVFAYNRKEFLFTIKLLESPIFASYPANLDYHMVRTIKLSTVLAQIYQFLILCCIILYLVYPILDDKKYPFPFPYDLEQYTVVMYTFQMIAELYSVENIANIDLTCTALMGIIGAQLDILCEELANIREDCVGSEEPCEISDEKSELVCERLKLCVMRHQAVICLVCSTELVFSGAFFFQFIASAFVICNTLFDFVLVPISLQTVLLVDYLILVLMQLFMYCWHGNEIMLKSMQVMDACYISKWYTCNNKVRRYLGIIMERSKRPLTLSVMKVSQLSLTSFTTILQWSYSYLALLLKLYSKQTEKQK